MPFVSSRDIALSVRKQAEKGYRAQLRKALTNPALTPGQRADLQRRLGQLGQERFYDAASPPPPGAFSFTPSQQVEPNFSEQQLRKMSRAELVTLARERELSASGTKTKLIERLLAR